MKRLLFIIAFFVAGCASVLPVNQATVTNIFHVDPDEPMLLTVELCVTGKYGARPAPTVMIIKELIEAPQGMREVGRSIAKGMYDRATNTIYMTAPFDTDTYQHELVHWANKWLAHDSNLFHKCSHPY